MFSFIYQFCREQNILPTLIGLALRWPRLAAAALVLLLAALASSMTYAGYLVTGVLADLMGSSRILAGLLLGTLFARVPLLRQGKLSSVGLLPRYARLPVMIALLVACAAWFIYHGNVGAALWLGFAATFLLGAKWMRQRLFDRMRSFLSKVLHGRRGPVNDESVIDVDFREKKD